MQTTTKEIRECGKRGRGGEIEEIMMWVRKKKWERGINSTSKRGKTEMRGIVPLAINVLSYRVCCSSKNSEYRLSCHARYRAPIVKPPFD